MPFAAAAGACVWGPDCQVPLTHGHWCTRCELPAHTACTFKNVMEFATRHRGTGADGERGERQYARAVETVAGAGVPCCARTGTGDRCGRAALCAHGRAMPVTRLRACRLNRADAQSSGEGAARPPLCADEAGESWSGRGHRGCTRRCLSRAGVRTPLLGSLTRPAAGAQATYPPPRLPPGDRRHLLCERVQGLMVRSVCPRSNGSAKAAGRGAAPRLHRCRCGRAALCAHGHGGQVRACRVVRARTRHACEAFASPAADAPSRARRLSHVDARSSGEGGARPPLCADEAGESWSGQGHRGCTRRCLSRAGVCTSVLGSLTRPAASARCWWRVQVQGRFGGACRQTAVDAAIGSLPHRARFAKQDSSVQRNTH